MTPALNPKTPDSSVSVEFISDPPKHWLDLTQALVNASTGALLAMDDAGWIFLSNQLAQKRFQAYPRDHAKALFPELWPFVSQTINDGQRRLELPLKRTDIDYFAAISPIIVNRSLVGAICVLEEHADLDSIAAKMRFFQEMNRELDAIINSSSDGLFVCDAQATVIRINPASERIHKIKADQVVGRNMTDLIQQGFIDRSAALEVCRTRETVSLLQNKQNRKLISTGTPVLDENGHLIRVVVSERDITELDTLQRRLEEEAAINHQFRHQILEMQQADLESRKIIARSACVVTTLQQALKVSSVSSTVLITGESGVGKGLIANLIHSHSERREKPLIRINCGAIPETLIESELFGYDKGAFTGAHTSGKPGYLELADGGTLFLDEIAELPLSAQVKLLRFLEDGRITRLGGTKSRYVDARILAATHRNLKEMAERGTFRYDLYYRLNVIPLHVPPVRERKECILPLIRYYVDLFARKNNTLKRLTRSAIDALTSYPYPGNVRELMNICERAVVMSETEVIDLQDLPKEIFSMPEADQPLATQWPPQMSFEQIMLSVERSVLFEAVEKNMNQCRIAEALGISQPTVARRLKRCGLR